MLLCLLVVRDEAYYLPGFFDHMRDHVDGFVVLDDGSTDRTVAIAEAERKVLDLLRNPVRESAHFLEHENRGRILTRAQELGADWVVCCDPDERFEQAFLRDLRTHVVAFERQGKWLIGFKLRELWDSPLHYRNDGVWGQKKKVHLFKLPATLTFNRQQYHGPWYPEELNHENAIHMTEYQVYHLKMIKLADRIGRRNRYNTLDPERKFQAIGYDYLTDEHGLTLRKISAHRGYGLETIPADQRAMKLPWHRLAGCLAGWWSV